MRVSLLSLPIDIAELDRDKGTLPDSWLPLWAPVKKLSMRECLSLMLKDLRVITQHKDGAWERAAHTLLTRELQRDWRTAAVIGQLHTHLAALIRGFSGFTCKPVLLPLVSTLYILSA